MAIVIAGVIGVVGVVGVIAGSHDDYSVHSRYSEYNDYAEKQKQKLNQEKTDIDQHIKELKRMIDENITDFSSTNSLFINKKVEYPKVIVTEEPSLEITDIEQTETDINNLKKNLNQTTKAKIEKELSDIIKNDEDSLKMIDDLILKINKIQLYKK